jgi:hypothetical protein
MTKRFGILLSLGWFFLAFLAMPAHAGEKIVNLGEHGALALQVPDGWVMDNSRGAADNPPTLAFKPPAGDEFAVLVTPFWNLDTSEHNLGEIAGNMLADIAAMAVERELGLVPLGGGATGYFFRATDSTLVSRKRIPDGEYLHLTSGAVATGDLVLTFTILTNERPSGVIDKALKMIAGAVHRTGA